LPLIVFQSRINSPGTRSSPSLYGRSCPWPSPPLGPTRCPSGTAPYYAYIMCILSILTPHPKERKHCQTLRRRHRSPYHRQAIPYPRTYAIYLFMILDLNHSSLTRLVVSATLRREGGEGIVHDLSWAPRLSTGVCPPHLRPVLRHPLHLNPTHIYTSLL
jgi:hypothetical protein